MFDDDEEDAEDDDGNVFAEVLFGSVADEEVLLEDSLVLGEGTHLKIDKLLDKVQGKLIRKAR